MYAMRLTSWQSGNTALTSSIVQYVIFVVTTGGMLPIIDRVGRRFLLVSGAIICMILHFASGALMASYGHYVDQIDGMSTESSGEWTWTRRTDSL
jgi:hypothetical protein